MERFEVCSAAKASHLSVAEHSKGGGGGLGLGAEAPHDADGLGHEAGVPHHCHPRLHHRLNPPDARRSPPLRRRSRGWSSAPADSAAVRA